LVSDEAALMPTVPGQGLTDDEVFGAKPEAAAPAPASAGLTDAEVFGDPSLGARVRAAARLGGGRNPQAVLEAEQLSGRYGMPAAVAERNLEEVRAQAQADDLAGLADRHPGLAEWYAQDPGNVAVAREDAGTLAQIGDFLQRVTVDPPRAAVGGLVSSVGTGIAGVGSMVDAGARGIDRGVRSLFGDAFADLFWFEDGPDALNPTFLLQGAGGGLEAAGGAVSPAQERQSLVTDIAGGLGQVTGQAAITLANPGAGILLMSGQGAEVQADRARAAGTYGDGGADAGIAAGATVTAITERVGLGFLLRRLPQGVQAAFRKRLTDILVSGAAEGTQEVAEGKLQDLVTQALVDSTHEGQSWSELVSKEGVVAGSVGLIFRSMLHLGRARVDQARAAQDQESLEAIGKLVDSTKLAEADPGRLRAALGALKTAGWENVWVPVNAWQTLFQSPQDADQARTAAGVDPHEYAAALVAGQQARVRIPMEGFFTLPPEQRAKLYPAARRVPDGMTPEEAAAHDPEKALGEFMAAIGEQGRPADDPSNAVYESMRVQLEAAGASPDVAAAQAEQFAAFARTQQARTGIDVDADRVAVQGALDPRVSEVLKGRDADPMVDSLLDAIRSGRTFTDQEVRGQQLVSALVQAGGLNPGSQGGGDLRGMDAGKRPGLVNLAGMSLDDALVWARENGFIDKPLTQEQDAYDANAPDISTLLDMIGSDLSGIDPQFAAGNLSVDREAFNQAVEALQEAMAERGLDAEALAGMSNAQAREALGLNAPADADGQQLEQPAYHGTHARGIEQEGFKLQKIGTGEGAQVYGWGLYFASRRGVAEWYRENVTRQRSPSQAEMVLKGERFPLDDEEKLVELFRLETPFPDAPAGVDEDAWIEAISEVFQGGVEDLAMMIRARGRMLDNDEWDRLVVRVSQPGSLSTPLEASVEVAGRSMVLGWKKLLRGATVQTAESHPFKYTTPEGTTERADVDDIAGMLSDEIDDLQDSAAAELAALMVRLGRLPTVDEAVQAAALNVKRDRPAIEAAVRELERSGVSVVERNPGQLYEVEVPEDGELLVYEKDLAEQPEAVQKALRAMKAPLPEYLMDRYGFEGDGTDSQTWGSFLDYLIEIGNEISGGWTGQQLYQELHQSLGSQQAASHALFEAGIPGLRYVDGSTRGKSANDQTYNYVIWDESRVAVKQTFYQGEVPPEFQASGRTRKSSHGDTSISYTSDGKTVDVVLVNTPKGKRGSGSARTAMQQFLSRTDAAGLPVTLTVAEQDASTDPARLAAFYRSLGFVRVGQSESGSPMMRREPRSAAPSGAPSATGDAKRGSLTITPDRQFLIRIGEAADFSTFLHESGHYFLEVMREIHADLLGRDPASLTEQQRRVLGDHDSLLRWMGVESFEAIERRHHEQFAETYEAYLREGRAPSPRLGSVFQKFGAWLRMIYRTLSGLPNARLNDEVRGIMDRMLATDAEIEAARQGQALQGLFATPEAAGWTPEEHARYQEALRVARDSAVTAEAAEQYRYEKAVAARWKSREMKRLLAEAQADVDRLPAMQAKYLLMRGTQPDGTPLADDRRPFKLNTAAVTDRYGKEWVKKNLAFMHAADGVHPSLAASVLGFQDGWAMIDAMAKLQPRRDLARAEAEARWAAEHPDPMLDGDLANRVQRHVHNEAQAEVMVRELAELQRLAGKEGKPPVLAVMRRAAERIVGATVVANLAPHQHRWAEARAGREAIKAAAEQRWDEALLARRQQLWSGLMYRAALDAQERAEANRALMVKLAKKPAQERLARAGWELYLERINDILSVFDVRRLSLRELQRRSSMRSWVEAQQEAGEVTAIPEALIAQVEANRASNWREVTVDALDAAGDALRNIEHLAGRKNKLVAARRKADKDEAVGELAARAEESLPDRVLQPVSARDLTTPQRVGRKLAKLRDEVTRPENVIEALDGGESGPWHDYFWHGLDVAEARIAELKRQVGERLKALRQASPADLMARLAEPVTVFGTPMTRGTLVGMVLNTGNAGNLQRLRDGGIEFNGQRVRLSDAQIGELRALLTPDELAYVQGLWDTVNSLWPEIVELQRRVSGLPPEQIEAQEFTVNGATYRGGYWPLAYDRDRSSTGERQSGDDALQIMMSQGFQRAATPKGYTKARAEKVEAPLQLDFAAVLSRHLDQVMTDLAYRETVRDTTALLEDQRIKDAIIGRLGRPAYDSLRGAVAYSVSGSSAIAGQVAGGWKNVADGVMSNMTVSALAIRPDIALGNYTSAMIQGLDRVGVRALMRGLWRIYTPGRGELTDEIKALSPFMRERLEDNDRVYRQELLRTENKRGLGEAYKRVMFTLHRAADHEVTRALWWGRYQQAIDGGADQAEAVRLADKAIRQTQTATARKDLSTFERDPAWRQTRQFMGPMFVIFGRMSAAARGQGASRTTGARIASVLIQSFLAPAIFALAAGRWPGEDGDDEDDVIGPGEWSVWLAANTLLFPLQTLPILRDAGSAIEAAATGNPINARTSPLGQAVQNMGRAGLSIWENLTDDDGDDEIDYLELTRDLAALGAPLVGAPASQVRLGTKAAEALRDDPDAGAVEMAQMAVYGPPKK
jgi:hypothetical protein